MRRLKSVASFRGGGATVAMGGIEADRPLAGVNNLPPACDTRHLLPMPDIGGSPAFPPVAPRVVATAMMQAPQTAEPTTLMFKVDPDACAMTSVVHLLPTFLFPEAVSEQGHSDYLRQQAASSGPKSSEPSSLVTHTASSHSGCSSTTLLPQYPDVNLRVHHPDAIFTTSRIGLKAQLFKELQLQLTQCYVCWLVNCSTTAAIAASIADLCDALDSTGITSRLPPDSQATLLAAFCEQQRLRSRCCVFVLIDATAEMAAYFIRRHCPSWGAHILCVPPTNYPRTALTPDGSRPWHLQTQQQALRDYHAGLRELVSNVDLVDIPMGAKDEVELFSSVRTGIIDKMRTVCEHIWLSRLVTAVTPPDFPPLDHAWFLKVAAVVEFSPVYCRILAFIMVENGLEAYDLHQLYLTKEREVQERMRTTGEAYAMSPTTQSPADQAAEDRNLQRRVACGTILRMLEHTLHPTDLPWARLLAVVPRQFPAMMFPTASCPSEVASDTSVHSLLVHLGIINFATGGLNSRTYWAAASLQQCYLQELTPDELNASCTLFHRRVCELNNRYPGTFYDDHLLLHDYLAAVEVSQRSGTPLPHSVQIPAAYQPNHSEHHQPLSSSGSATPPTQSVSPLLDAKSNSPKSSRTLHLGEEEMAVGRRGSLGLGGPIEFFEATSRGGKVRSGSLHSDIVDGGDLLFETRRSRRVSLSLSVNPAASDPVAEKHTWRRWGATVKSHLLELVTRLNIPVLDIGAAIPQERCRTINDLVTLPPLPAEDHLLTPELATLFHSYCVLYLHRGEPATAATALERALCIYLHHFNAVSSDVERRFRPSGPSESIAALKRKAAAANAAAGSFRVFGSFRGKPSVSTQENGAHSFLFALLLTDIRQTYLNLAHCYHAAKLTGMAAPYIERANSVLQLLNGGRRDTPARTAGLLPKALLEQYLGAMEVHRGFSVKESSAEIDRGTPLEKDVALRETIQSEVNEGHYARNAKTIAEEALRALSVCDEKLVGRLKASCYRHVAVGLVYTDQDSQAAEAAQKASESYLTCTTDSLQPLVNSTVAPPLSYAAVRTTGTSIYPRLPPSNSALSLADRQRETSWVRSMLPEFYAAIETANYIKVNDLLDRSILFSHYGLLPSAADVPIICFGKELTAQLLKTEFPVPTAHEHLQLHVGFTDLEVARHYGNDWRKSPSKYLLPVHTLLLNYPRFEAPVSSPTGSPTLSGATQRNLTGLGPKTDTVAVSEASRQLEVQAFKLFLRLMKTGVSPNACSPHDMKTLLHLAVEKDLSPVVLALLTDFGADPEYTPKLAMASSRSGLSTVASITQVPNRTLDSPMNLCMANPLMLTVLLSVARNPLQRFLRHGSRIIERMAAAPNRQDLLDGLFAEDSSSERKPVLGLPLRSFVPALVCGTPIPLSASQEAELGNTTAAPPTTIHLSSTTKEFLVGYLPNQSALLMAAIERIDLTDSFLLVTLLKKLQGAFKRDNELATTSAANSPLASKQPSSHYQPFSSLVAESPSAVARRFLPGSDAKRNGTNFASCVTSSMLAGGRSGPVKITTLEFDIAVKHVLRRCVGDRFQILAALNSSGGQRRQFHTYADSPQLSELQVRQLQSNEKGYTQTIQHLLSTFDGNVSPVDVADEEKELNSAPL